MWRSARSLVFGVTLGLVGVGTSGSVAFAQGDPAAADALFRRGREAAERGDWEVACPQFAESQRLDPAPGTLLNLAGCEEHVGQVASAYEHYRAAIDTLPRSDDRLPFARQHLAALEKRVPHLTLDAAAALPKGARVERDDVALGAASLGLALPVNPGLHRIVVKAEGRAEAVVTVRVAEGEAKRVVLEAGAPRATVSLEASGPVVVPMGNERGEHRDEPTSSPHPLRGVAIGALAVGGVGVVLGAVAGGIVLGKKSVIQDPSHCDQTTHACDQTGADA
ncbi:MAG TPA: hypothetical protein VGI39_19340, partial [Polyangiaceae bacterium]